LKCLRYFGGVGRSFGSEKGKGLEAGRRRADRRIARPNDAGRRDGAQAGSGGLRGGVEPIAGSNDAPPRFMVRRRGVIEEGERPMRAAVQRTSPDGGGGLAEAIIAGCRHGRPLA
jgi:hypothetical protein